jgi:hypothetical protein
VVRAPDAKGTQPQLSTTTVPNPTGAAMPATPVYHYRNPMNNQHIVSLLPPDHPEMICLQQGSHVPTSKFGVLGLLAAVFWFPLGIGLCLLDRKVQCKRCGAMISDGMCG